MQLNQKAKELVSGHHIEDLEKQMDETSKKVWHTFLKDAASSSNASCRLYLSDTTNAGFYEVEGRFDSSIRQYAIRFREIQVQDSPYESFFEYAPFGIMFLNLDGTIVDANQQIEELLVSPKELVGKNVTMISDLFSETTQGCLHFSKTLMSKKPSEMITKIMKANGESKHVKFESSFIYNLDMHMIVVRDVTEQILLEKQLSHSQSLSTLGQLAASIAHEIRNPLTSLKGFTQLLAHQVSSEGDHFLGIINTELIRMESILNEFLVLSKPGERSLQIISISAMIKQVVELMNPQASIQNIEMEFLSADTESDSLLGDAHELKKVIMNILKNAIEVMPHGGKVSISQTLDENNRVRISVTDQGCGMTADQVEKIFLPFYTSKKLGTGLGLAHAIQTVEDHGGRIEVDSVIGEGTTFHLILPITQVDAIREYAKYDQSHGKSNWEVVSTN